MPYHALASAASRRRCAPERSTTTAVGRRRERRSLVVPEAEEEHVGPARRGSSFDTNAGSDPFSRGSRLCAALPACESEPSASTSIEGCPISRSSVSWPVYPAFPRIAAVGICVLCTIVQTMQRLVLEDGTVFDGVAVGAPGVAAGEACFTTAMTGYEEAVTDPSYVAQVLCFAYPLIGTYGVDESRMESDRVQCEGVVMRDVRPEFAGWLRGRGVVALAGVDTRTLVRRIRDEGVVRCALGDAPVASCTRAHWPSRRSTAGRSTARSARKKPFSRRRRPARHRRRSRLEALDPAAARARGPRGVRRAGLMGRGRDPRVEAASRADRERTGRSAVLTDQVETIRSLLGAVPLFRRLPRAPAARARARHETFKLPFGHRGANHPVRDLATGRVLVTVQNHGFAVDADDDVSHVSLNDGTCEGLAATASRASSSTPRRRPGRSTACPFFDRLATRAEAHRPSLDPDPRLRPIRIGQACEFDYSGAQAVPRAAARGLPRRARELEPGDDHDRPRVGRRDLPRAARRRDGRAGDRARAARRDPADARRPDGAQPRGRARAARIELIGADLGAIERAEDRELFRETVHATGIPTPRSIVAHSPDVDFPCPRSCDRRSPSAAPAAGIAFTPDELRARSRTGSR
jgi:carbamoyl-phosphate synthase small subunit